MAAAVAGLRGVGEAWRTLVSSCDWLKSGAGVVVVLLALRRPCPLSSSESRNKTLFFLREEGVLVASVEALGEGEESSVVDEPLVLPSVEVAASGVVDEAVAFSLLLHKVGFIDHSFTDN